MLVSARWKMQDAPSPGSRWNSTPPPTPQVPKNSSSLPCPRNRSRVGRWVEPSGFVAMSPKTPTGGPQRPHKERACHCAAAWGQIAWRGWWNEQKVGKCAAKFAVCPICLVLFVHGISFCHTGPGHLEQSVETGRARRRSLGHAEPNREGRKPPLLPQHFCFEMEESAMSGIELGSENTRRKGCHGALQVLGLMEKPQMWPSGRVCSWIWR